MPVPKNKHAKKKVNEYQKNQKKPKNQKIKNQNQKMKTPLISIAIIIYFAFFASFLASSFADASPVSFASRYSAPPNWQRLDRASSNSILSFTVNLKQVSNLIKFLKGKHIECLISLSLSGFVIKKSKTWTNSNPCSGTFQTRVPKITKNIGAWNKSTTSFLLRRKPLRKSKPIFKVKERKKKERRGGLEN